VAYPIYDFPSLEPFKGDSLFNPYKDLNGKWLKANFHTHSSTWYGLTSGMETPDAVIKKYRQLGYDLYGISNYQQIFKPAQFDSNLVPVYEHGFSILKHHQLVIGARNVLWFDYILPQNIHQKQFILNCLADENVVLGINHPAFMGGFSAIVLAKLTNYDCLEVVSHLRRSPEYLDTALSAGRYPVIIGNDDSHNINDMGQTGVFWTMVNTPSKQLSDILEALRKGRTYAVGGKLAYMDIAINEVKIRKDTLMISCDGTADRIEYIGQSGGILKVDSNTNTFSYKVRDTDSYVRIQIQTPKCKLYLNPIVRYDGKEIVKVSATINWGRSIVLWLSFVVGYSYSICILRKWYLKGKK
jgi:hypothetical protein